MVLPITVVMLAGFALTTIMNVLMTGPDAARLAGFAVCLTLVFTLQLAHSLAGPRHWRAGTRATTLTLQALATYLPFWWLGSAWGGMIGFLAGSALLSVTGPARWPLYVAGGAGILPVLASEGVPPVGLAYGTGFALLTGLVVYGMSSLSTLVAELYAARGKLARMAVTRERLRVARDLHDLLGYSLSAITLKSELTHRLLPAHPHRARDEITDILTVARQALSDVRTVANGYRTMSLTTEADSATSVLTAADIDVTTTITTPDLPPHIETVLATVLREAVTNILRHSKAQHATIHATLHTNGHNDTIRLHIANDGVDPTETTPTVNGGNGLGNLTTRLRTINGHLTAGIDTDGWFHLTAQAPTTTTGHRPVPERALPPDAIVPRLVPRLAQRALSRGPAPRADPADGAAPRVSPLWRLRSARHRLKQMLPFPRAGMVPDDVDTDLWGPRQPIPVTLVVLAGYAAIMLINVIDAAPGTAGLLGFAACLAADLGLQLVHSFRGPRSWSRGARVFSLCAQALVCYLPLLWVGRPWGSMVGFLAGSVLLVVPGGAGWALYAAVVGSVVPLAMALGAEPRYLVYLPVSSLLTGMIVYGMSSLSTLVAELYAARGKLARMAVTRERLRVARDLHDLLGYSLSAITLKSELTHRLLPAHPHRARDEITDILTVARQALSDVRTVANGYRTMSLTTEADSATSVLTAADIDVTTTITTPDLPPHIETVLATVLREAVTNILRHSKAQHATIHATLHTNGHNDTIRLHIANDGVDPTETTPTVNGGNGLGNLTTRLRTINGHLTAGIDTDGWFHLTAQAPTTTTGLGEDYPGEHAAMGAAGPPVP
ncbi:histidine kinase [Sphaerisporangium sp. NPDC005288]|uniref:sensor histidine kinase n=1 Tax=Sphaerisporangium sp. NPDC005288 TaxID=3155114 RepID=UPI0033A9DFA3